MSRVSIITPFLNGGIFLRQAVQSVLAQTYQDWELLLIDDGSNDGSSEIATFYAKAYPGKIVYTEHPSHQNRGLSASRNMGIRAADGEFIAFLDSDDFWLPRKLEEQLEILAHYPQAAMVYGRSKYWRSWSTRPQGLCEDYTPELGMGTNRLYEPPELFIRCTLRNALTPPPSDIFIRHEALHEPVMFEENFRGMYEDQVFLAKFFLKAAVYVSNACWTLYRQHPHSLCAQAAHDPEVDIWRIQYLRWLVRYVSQQNLDNAELRRSMTRISWPLRYPMAYRWSRPIRSLASRLCANDQNLVSVS